MSEPMVSAESAERILVVDDVVPQAALAQQFLTARGYAVRIAATAAQAQAIARDWQPDGLLLDLELPDFDGLELLGRLRAEGSDAVVVVMTASASMETAKQAIRAGAEDYVVKPYNQDRLSITLRNALQHRALTRSRDGVATPPEPEVTRTAEPVPGSRERVLVVEDVATQAELARLLLVELGYDVRTAATASAGLTIAREWQPDALLLDLELPDFDGIDLLRLIRAEGSDAAVVVVTANATMEIRAIAAGAQDYVVKPYTRNRISVTLRNVLDARLLVRSSEALKTELSRANSRLAKRDRNGFGGFIGASDRMNTVYEIIQSVARSKASVFITGESGTGKELAAEALHKASPRVGGRFVALNCGAIPRDLLESEVFGHVKGAFTGATSDRVGAAKLADGGTLFLDEIGEMPLEMQVKLLRFVQTGTFSPVGSSKPGKVDVRFVCATNRDPMLEVQAGRFREDLYYRLYVVPLELPPLRERGEDTLLIARHFLGLFAREEHRRFRGFSPQAERMLMAYAWPGNVRQLQNVVRNVVVLHDGDLVVPEMIPPPVNRPIAIRPRTDVAAPPPAVLQSARPEAAVAEDPREPPPVAEVAEPLRAPAGSGRAIVPEIEIMPLAEMERRLVLAALARTDGDIPRAAALLEINPSTVYRKVGTWRKDGLMPPEQTAAQKPRCAFPAGTG